MPGQRTIQRRNSLLLDLTWVVCSVNGKSLSYLPTGFKTSSEFDKKNNSQSGSQLYILI